jgi:hypothetical protein
MTFLNIFLRIYLPNLEHGLPVTKKPRKAPNIIDPAASLFKIHGSVLHSKNMKYKNPSIKPPTTPKKGFQKYHVVKNSLTFFGFGVTLQEFAISTYLYISMQIYKLLFKSQ